MDEHPVALAMQARSPNSRVSKEMYGVSPQPEHAPENSKSGLSSCTFFTESNFIAPFLCMSGSCRKKSQLTRSRSRRGSCGSMLRALREELLLSFAGQTSTHNLQPVQSSTAT